MPQTSALRARLESLFVRALAGLEIFKDAGHLPQLDDPLRFIDVLEDFVASTKPLHILHRALDGAPALPWRTHRNLTWPGTDGG